MSNRSLFEINHDLAHRIEHDPLGFMEAFAAFTASASERNAEALEHFGLRWFGTRHHSEAFRIEWGGERHEHTP